MTTHTIAIAIDTLPFENIADFGYRLSEFEQAHPDVRFSWEEAEYADEDEEDEDGGLLLDGENVFEKDINRAVFLVHFEDKRGLELYRTFRAAEFAQTPLGMVMARLGLTAVA